MKCHEETTSSQAILPSPTCNVNALVIRSLTTSRHEPQPICSSGQTQVFKRTKNVCDLSLFHHVQTTLKSDKLNAMNTAGLRRFWFESTHRHAVGVGVTAYSLNDARALIAAELDLTGFRLEDLGTVTEDIDMRELDQNHVIPNMGPCNLRGIWFPVTRPQS